VIIFTLTNIVSWKVAKFKYLEMTETMKIYIHGAMKSR